MTEEAFKKRRGPSDPTDYSSTQAPETQKVAEGRQQLPTDERLEPGGEDGTPADPGMSSLDRESTLTGGKTTGGTDFERTEDAGRK